MACKPAKFHLLKPASIPSKIIRKNVKGQICKSIQALKPIVILKVGRKYIA